MDNVNDFLGEFSLRDVALIFALCVLTMAIWHHGVLRLITDGIEA